MSGLFGVIARDDCRQTLFYGTDYHSHLGTQKAGLATISSSGRIYRAIHNINTDQFKSKFLNELPLMRGKAGVGVISDNDPQPIIVFSSFGKFALVTNGLLLNKEKLVKEIISQGGSFSEASSGEINTTEVVGKIIAQKSSIALGIKWLFEKIEGSITLLVLNQKGIYAARDPWGRTTLTVARGEKGFAVGSETCSFPNLGFEPIKQLKPGEIIFLGKEKIKDLGEVFRQGKTCAFLWIYTGSPASTYENVAVEKVRERCGANLAKNDRVKADYVTGIPDSGIAHALGYASASRLPYRRPLIKYTDGYGRSYTPNSKKIRDKIAAMKLIPIKDLIKGKKIIICDDSIVRGTQLKSQAIAKLWRYGAEEVHARIACPPLMFPCQYSLSTRTQKELIAQRAIKKIFGLKRKPNGWRPNENTSQYRKIIGYIRQEIGVTSLRYQKIEEMVKAIGLPKRKLCLYCWNGEK